MDFEIFFSDLNEDAQKRLLEAVGAKDPAEMKWDLDICPIGLYPLPEYDVELENYKYHYRLKLTMYIRDQKHGFTDANEFIIAINRPLPRDELEELIDRANTILNNDFTELAKKREHALQSGLTYMNSPDGVGVDTLAKGLAELGGFPVKEADRYNFKGEITDTYLVEQ